MMKLIKKYRNFLLIVFILLLLIHFALKDNYPLISTVFYSTPLITIIFYGIVLCFIFCRKRKLVPLLSALLTLLTFYFFSNYYFNNKASVKNTTSLVFWNVAKKEHFPIEIISNIIREHNPNILSFVEAVDVSNEDLNTLNKLHSEFEFKVLKGNMLIGIKGSIIETNYLSKSDNYRFNIIKALVKNKELSILMTDLYASPLKDKTEAFEQIALYNKTHSFDFILGDFNTPYESIHFKQLKNNFTSFHSKSNGFTATWPFGIPLLELDQIWISKKFNPIKLNKHYFQNSSDHALLVASYQ